MFPPDHSSEHASTNLPSHSKETQPRMELRNRLDLGQFPDARLEATHESEVAQGLSLGDLMLCVDKHEVRN